MAIVFAATTIQAQDAKVPSDKSGFHIFVLMGQSNMAGSGEPVLPEYVRLDSRVLIIGDDLKWTASKINFGSALSPGQVFARHYAELHPGITVGLIQGARPARGIKELAKGGKDRDGTPNYDKLIATVKEAMKVGTIKGILWHQGETDCRDAGYVEKLKSLASDVRTDIGDQDVPFIAGELGRFVTWTSAFNALIPKARTAIPNCSVASSDQLMDLGDKTHFSGFSCEVLGSRYLMEYLTMREPELAAKFKPALDDLTDRMIAKDAAWVTLLNPSMTEGETRPLGWDRESVAAGNLDAIRDPSNFASAPASLRVESVNGPVTGFVSTSLKDVCGRNLKITCKIKNAGFTNCSLNLNGMDGSWKPVLNQNVVEAKDAKDWTTYTTEFFVPANAMNTKLGFAVSGEGKAWLDDLVIEKSSKIVQSLATDTNAAPTGPVIPASDARFRYEGRFDFADTNAPGVVWQASRIALDFTGDSLLLRFDDAKGQNFFNAQVDGSNTVVEIPEGSPTTTATLSGLGTGRHHLTLFKRSEAIAGTVHFRAVELTAGAKAWPPDSPTYKLKMEFIGDSITVGACNEDGATDQWTNRLSHNAAASYAELTAAAFVADYRNIAVSGMGIATGWVEPKAGEVWDRIYPHPSSPRADLSQWMPQVIFLNLGENDDGYPRAHGLTFPTNFTSGYVALVRAIRIAHPDARIVLLRGGMYGGAQSERLRDAWESAVAQLEADDKAISHFVFKHWAKTHPRVADDRIMADELISWLKRQKFMPP